MDVDMPSVSDSSTEATAVGRKRQRSSSMESSTPSTSPKRSASEDPAQDNTPVAVRSAAPEDAIATPPVDDIDSYMAEQGEANNDLHITFTSPNADSFTHPTASSSLSTPLAPPTPATASFTTTPNTYASSSTDTGEVTPSERYAIIQTHRKEQMEVGQTWYLVSRLWYRRWEKAYTGEVDKQGTVSIQDVGPVDNRDLLVSLSGDLQLKTSLFEGVDVEYVSEEAWKLFVLWFGSPEHPLPRKVIARGTTSEPSLELYPLRLQTFRLVKFDAGPDGATPIHGDKLPDVIISCQATTANLRKEFFKTARQSALSNFRVWKLAEEIEPADGSSYPIQRLLSGGGDILSDDRTKTLEDDLINPGDSFAVEFMDVEQHWLVNEKEVKSTGSVEATVKPKGLLGPVFGNGGGTDFFSRLTRTSSTSASTSARQVESSSSKSYPSTSLTTLTKSKSETKAGTMGLGNMGNTCFMNSALQCLAHQEELVDYFLTGVYKQELNRDNPLGMHGAIAEAFGALLNRLWTSSSSASSYTPREFKMQLQRFAPQFSGYQQHDSQELVAFLLDGLHEDLNRIVKKPYVEKPDWEGGDEKELIQLANTSWEGYMKRNDSVIVDLFQGQYKSTLVCPECEKVSITFDPFMYLTLPLPVQKKWRHDIHYVPWDLDKPHLKVSIEISRDASFKELKKLLGRWVEAEPDNLLTLEIFSHRFYKNLEDNVMVGDMQQNDLIVCFELPCNAQQSRSYKPTGTDPFILPVFLSDLPSSIAPPRYTSFNKNNGTSLWGYPFAVVVEREHAQDEALIYDAIVERMKRWTVHSRDLYDWEAGFAPGPTVNNGMTDAPEEEGDITDQTDLLLEDLDSAEVHPPKCRGIKRDLFNLRVQTGHRHYGTSTTYVHGGGRFESWDSRREQAEESGNPVLLREEDGLFCEFDPNMKSYYFGEERRLENARWDNWTDFIHPEYAEAQKAAAQKQTKGITLADCLEEFIKEEKLGEEDLWYCPRCKKHQQATKKFDIWKMPDILVVHLKRFSNNRMLRDKIDTFVDFPVEGLDLEYLAEERHVAKRLAEKGEDIAELVTGDLDEPLVYDLFGVDEHLGGLGGGHYRAYAKHHQSGSWHHFDDSYVTLSKPSDAVNANAYLLFYRRRTHEQLGARTAEKVKAAKENPIESTTPPQLPTPPEDSMFTSRTNMFSRMQGGYMSNSGMPTPRSNGISSPSSSPPLVDDDDSYPLTATTLMQHDDVEFSNLMNMPSAYQFPNPPSRGSSNSSREVLPDLDDDDNSLFRRRSYNHYDRARGTSPPSPTSPSTDPFGDMNSQREDSDMMENQIPVKEIPVEDSTLLDID